MNDLQALHAFLSNAMLTDTRTALANAVAWLDPTSILGMSQGDDEDHYYYDERDDYAYALSVALRICRVCFPTIYTSTSQLIVRGATQDEIERHVCDSFNAYLATPIEDILEIPQGIPVQPMGICFWDYDFWEQHHNLHPFLADFGITEKGVNEDSLKFADVEPIAAVLKHSLEQQPGDTYLKIVHLLEWVFSASGNTSIDMSAEEFYESGIAPLDWTPDNIAFMNEIHKEAEAIIAEAEQGLELLLSDPELHTVFRQNLRLVKRTLARQAKSSKQKGKSHDNATRFTKRLQWPERP